MRMSSARPWNLEIMGTVPREFCQEPKFLSSSRKSTSASSTRRWRRAWFAATTAFKSSTLYALMPFTWLAPLSSILRGTEISTSIVSRCTTPSKFSLYKIGCMAPVHAKVTCALPTHSSIASSFAGMRLASGKRAWSSWIRSCPRFTMVIDFGFRGIRCCTSRRAILPAPRIQTSNWCMSRLKSCIHFFSTSSTAAEEIETPPREMPVSVRTRLPADTAVLSMRVSTLPAAPALSVLSS
mmetsp:Transcript_17092/g.27448  ORF Transcript_17092/g.27448 Transcript_17092/m.27448 type:complete len:239 (-) Transcript_17092:691-1407(-)